MGKHLYWMMVCIGLMHSACGYRFSGTGAFPAGARSIFVSTFENRSAETGLEGVLTADLIREITLSQKASLAQKSAADAVLSGVIRSVSSDSIARRALAASLERRVYAVVDIQLTDARGGVLWSAEGVATNEEYAVSVNKLSTEQNRRQALAKLSQRLAEEIVNRLNADF